MGNRERGDENGDEENAVLELTTRRKLYQLIRNNPGVHFRELQRLSQFAMGVLEYQLQILEKENLISKVKHGPYTRYFAKGDMPYSDWKIACYLRQGIGRKIILYLIYHPGAKHKDLKEALNLPPSTVSYYLQQLLKDEIVLQKDKRYWVKDSKRVMRILITYKPSFFDEITARLVDLWSSI